MRMLPTRLPGSFRHVVPPPAAAYGQRIAQTAAAALLVALAALSIRLTLAPDVVARFSHMGYVGGLVMNAISSATVFLPMPGVLHTLAVASTSQPLALAVAAGIGCALGELTGYLLGLALYVLLRNRRHAPLARLHGLGRRYGAGAVFVVAVAPTPLFDVVGIAAGLARMRLWVFLLWTSLGKGLKYYVFFSFVIGLPLWMQGRIGMVPSPTPVPVTPSPVQAAVQGDGAGNQVLEDVPLQFRTLQHYGVPLAFHLGAGTDPRECRHYQGIARTAAADGTPLFFLTQSGSPNLACPEDVVYYAPAEILVAQMPSRNRSGEFLGSNRLQRNLAAGDTQPPSIDRGVAVIRFDGQSTDSTGQPWPRYWHAGGTQLIENVLVVPLECCDCGWTWLIDPLRNWVRRDCIHRSTECPGNAGLALIDVRGFDLTHPAAAQFTLLHHQTFSVDSLGVVAVTQTPDRGTYLFAFTWGDSSILRFAESDTDDLRTTREIALLPQVWHADYLTSGHWRAWQMLNFLRDADGNIYLVGTDNDTALTFGGDDWIALFALDMKQLRQGDMRKALKLVQERRLMLGDPNMGDLDAAGGIYVSPSGALTLYTADHDNEGPVDDERQWVVEMGEFSALDFSARSRVSAATSWVEICADKEGWRDTTMDRCLLFTPSEQDQDNWDDLNLHEGFGNEIESVRWRLPQDLTVALYRQPHFEGQALYLRGTGSVAAIADLQGPFVAGGQSTANWQNDIESLQLIAREENTPWPPKR